MQQKLLETVIYYLIAVEKEEKRNLNEVIRIIKLSKTNFEKELFLIPKPHPARVSYEEISQLSEEKYKKISNVLTEKIYYYIAEESQEFLGFTSCKDVEDYAMCIVLKAQKMFELGLRYFFGEDIEQNYEKAINIFNELNEKCNHKESKFWLEILSYLEEVYENEKAYKYFLDRFEESEEILDYFNGLMYYYGGNVEQDYEKAYNIFKELDYFKEYGYYITEQKFFDKNTTIQNEEYAKELEKYLLKSILNYYYIPLKIEEIENILEEDYESLKDKIHQRPRIEPERIYFKRIEDLTLEEYTSIVKQLKENIAEFVKIEKVEEIDVREEDNINKYVEKIVQ